MTFISTRGQSEPVDFNTALVAGLASDGGLYTPVTIPDSVTSTDYVSAVSGALRAFGASDTDEIVKEAAQTFRHPDVAPIAEVGDRLVLELFHGPTISFKDHALQVVARLLAREVSEGIVLGATSGDTGSAAIEAVRHTHLRIVMLYPDGRVSEFQRRQMTTVPDRNVTTVAVRGTFDDCQRMVKEAFANHPELLAVNSINFARIAAQVGYHLYASEVVGDEYDIVVPTGNFGNVYSAWLAKQMGAAIETITIANNANHYLADLVNTGHAQPQTAIPTLAPAMDIQVPSNLERFSGDPSSEFRASWADDGQIKATMTRVEDQHGYRIDPHTATAWAAGEETMSGRTQVIVSTAHPAKFDQSVEPPAWLGAVDGEERIRTIDANTSELEHLLR